MVEEEELLEENLALQHNTRNTRLSRLCKN
jgi:hypothetical protein